VTRLRIVDFDELPQSMEGSVQLLDATAGWTPMAFQAVREAMGQGYPSADYFGVYAVEGREALSMIRVLRVPFTTTEGRETVSCIQGVVTRRDKSGHGLARRLLDEVRRRERTAGSRFLLLWTSQAQTAHTLYNSVGYVDLYTPPLAMCRSTVKRAKPDGYELRKVRRQDFGTMERLHADATEGFVGFTPRPANLLECLLRLGVIKPDSFRLILRDGKPAGYVELEKSQGWAQTQEIVLEDPTAAEDVISLLESEASDGWLALRGTFVRKNLRTLKRRRYSFSDYSYFGMLGLTIGGPSASLKELGTTDLRFSCQYLDYF
jgi:GNAT superfamily N-acetyltransferase